MRDLADIAAYIERESGSRGVAEAFIDHLTAFCEHLSTLPELMGRDRSELRLGYRSTVFGNYVIFLRYADENGPRSDLYVVNVIHGARDVDTLFASKSDEGEP